jgi:hypothetical protein
MNLISITVKYDPVRRAFDLIRVIYDLEGDGGRQGLYVTLMKVKTKVPG